jgi:hypothetical protein
MKTARAGLWLLIFAFALLQGFLYYLYGLMEPDYGLIARYYSSADLSGKQKMLTNDPEISPWIIRKRVRNLPRGPFSVQWAGFLKSEDSGQISFLLPKGGRLILDQQEILYNSNGKNKTVHTTLEKGLHPIRVEYSFTGGAIRMELSWSKDGRNFETVPALNLQPGSEGFWFASARRTLEYCLAIFPYFWVAFGGYWIARLLFRLTRTAGLFASSYSFFLFLFAACSGILFFLWRQIPFPLFPAELWYGALLVYSAIGLVVIASLLLWRPRLPQIILVVFSLLISLVTAEVTVRALYPYQFLQKFEGVTSHYYHHLYQPHRNMFVGFSDQIPVTVRTNEDGLRTDYSRKQYLRYHNRIAILGDSFVFGYGVRQEARFSNQLEILLRKKNPDVAVLNAGVISYSPFLENLLYRGIVKQYKPNLVILFLDVSDIGDDYRYAQEVKTDGPRPYFGWEDYRGASHYGVIVELLRRQHFFWDALTFPVTLAARIWNGPEPPKKEYDYYKFYLKIGDSIERNRYFIYRHPLEQTHSYFDATLRNIENVRNAVRASGADFLLVLIPRFTHWNPKECPANWERNAYSRNEPYQFEFFRFFDQEKGRVDFPIFNLLPAFQETKEFPLVLHGDPHWNERGHAFVAKTLAEYLTTRTRIH